MTLKKNYEQDRAPRAPKVRVGTEKNRNEMRIKHALRHGDFDALYADELDELGDVREDDDE